MCSKHQSISPDPNWSSSPKYTSMMFARFSQPISGWFSNLNNSPVFAKRYITALCRHRDWKVAQLLVNALTVPVKYYFSSSNATSQAQLCNNSRATAP
jgi:hypothetical protein